MNTSPLNSSKTPGSIVTEIHMMRSTFKGIHFLVEGEDDSKFWKDYLHRENVTLVNCEGKPNLIATALQIEAAAIPRVTGVYDADFDRLHGTHPHSPNILTPTDDNDLETMLLKSAALDKLLSQYADAKKLAAFQDRIGKTVVEHVAQTARHFGQLRFLNSVANLRIDFKHLSPYRFVEIESWNVKTDELQAKFAELTSTSPAELATALQTHCQHDTEWAYVQGHDATRILAQGLRKTIANEQMDEHSVTRILRTAFTDILLKQTTMYAALRTITAKMPVQLFK